VILLDLGVTSNMVLSQRQIYGIAAGARSRLNGIFMAIFFAGGALGSALASWSYAVGGWSLLSWIGCAFGVVALILYGFEFLGERRTN
jgi:predicted MFS family arabinose efflux permease